MNLNDVKTIVNNLEDFIEVRDGIERLRMIIRTLAVSGKLVPQNFTDGTGEDLVNQIEATRLIIGSRKRKDREGTQVTDAETFFEIPKSWKWVRFGFVFDDYGSGSTPSRGSDVFYKNGKINWYKSGELKDGILSEDSEERIAQEALERCHLRLNKPGDLLLAMYGATAGRLAILKNHGTTNQAVWGGTPNKFVSLDYLFLYMLQSRSELLKMSSGAAQPNISGEKIISHVFPLPPYAEQERIVARVEEIMIQLDALQMKKRERDDVRGRLTKNAMHSLGLGDTDIALQNLEELVKTPNDLKELEKSILTLAVSGRLVSHDSKDGDANDSYTRILRDNLGRKKKNEVIMPQDINKTPFDIPNTWKWVSLGDICGFEYGFTDSAKDEGGARFVRITDMGNDSRLISENHKFVDLNDESKKAMLREGDALVARIGATFGRTILFKEKYPAVYASYLIRITFDKNFLLPDYYWIFAQSNAYWDQALSLVSGSAQPQFNANLIKKIVLPVPPHAEQIRIVKKVEEMMELIRSLGLVLSKK